MLKEQGKTKIMNPGNVFIIGEAGVNHNGELEKAYTLVDIACRAGVDAVKFQTFKPGECTGKFAVKAGYLKKTSPREESRYDISRKLALPYEDFIKIQKYAKDKKIVFLTTPDGYESLEFVNDILDIPVIKISSTEVTHLEFLEAVAKKEKPIIFSTGLSTLDEVRKALEIMRKFNPDITVLHCTSEYPALPEDVNIKAMVSMRDSFGVKVGYSDHTLGKEAAIAAVAFGASVIEKHFTIDKSLAGPDHGISLSPDELNEYVSAIRTAETIMGDGVKQPKESELKNIEGIRRSVVAGRRLKKGSRITREDLTFKRPASGIHPYDLEKVLGKTTTKDLEEDEPLKWDHIK